MLWPATCEGWTAGVLGEGGVGRGGYWVDGSMGRWVDGCLVCAGRSFMGHLVDKTGTYSSMGKGLSLSL